ncbi:CRISPR-associated exonuclease Cas4 [Methanohalophilus levihalophilus]|uniref:CRISPR-associated protein Cas4 n=1 Tax=Methanohalophilus levihalophilus TaxID=1431282 RepID=UPI001AE7FE81|nr:Dna2/Cas4 domain-containing protein [Methanohalophilus levihalophilus]MBP2030018.1 CRISPR-associated exonuclease Cas4 [Methanohalophilus levihalophilus]
MPENIPQILNKLSDVALYLRCPRKVYFEYRENEREMQPVLFAKHLLIKELAYSYHELLDSASDRNELVNSMQEKLYEAAADFVHIYAAEAEDLASTDIQENVAEITGLLEEIASNLMAHCDEHGKKKAINMITPVEIELILSNEAIKLTGQIPAIVELDETPSPMLIKTGNAPESGIWKNDRIHLAASSLLLAEYSGTHAAEGIVQYAASGNIRRTRIHTADRRNALNVIKKIEKIKKGKMPERKENPLCESCEFRESCISKPTSLASRLF